MNKFIDLPWAAPFPILTIGMALSKTQALWAFDLIHFDAGQPMSLTDSLPVELSLPTKPVQTG